MNSYFLTKNDCKLIIPKNIFQTWHTKMLPPLMYNAIKKLTKCNPEFSYKLFDDNDCREFIKRHFRADVLHAYNSLIPGAYKADLWRYCVLFIHGGIYLDIKYAPLNGFKFINLCKSEHFVLDSDEAGIYNALIVALPGNKILFSAIRKIVENVKNKYYGESFLSPTGPKLLTKFISVKHPIVDLKHKQIKNVNYKFIYYQNIPVLKSYYGHIVEREKHSIKQHYATLWHNKNIYA